MAEAFIFHVLDDRTLEFRQTEPIMLEDNNVTEFIFRIPKTLNELDVSSWSWWFVYKNANNDKYSSPLLLTDDTDEPDLYSNATYWVDHGFTQKAGRVEVALEALNIGTGDAPANEWHTKTYIIDVNDTLQGNQIEFKPSEVDIISGMLQSTLNQIREMIETGGGGGTSDDIENKSTVSGATVTDALGSLSDQIANLEGGAPTPAATVSAMVDTTKIYLYTGSETGYNAGHWYYYNGGQWVDGGQYGEAASMSAGVKAALLACFRQVAWIGDDGQDYYDALYNELYPPASLVSITATYTQSGTVYDTASLDDLKPDLVVTANYSDGTSETVTGYTLSGTLAEGTSTITVAYGGKTTTFTVTVTHKEVALYPLVDGTYALGTTTTLTVTNGNHVRFYAPKGFPATGGAFANIKDGKYASSSNIIDDKPKWFTIPSGENTVFTIDNVSNPSGVVFNVNFRLALAKASSSFGIGNSTHLSGETVTQNLSTAEDVSCLFIYFSPVTFSDETVLEFDVALTVGNTKYI